MSKETNTDTVGARIREKRKDKGFSQEKLADLLMVKQTTLSKYENDEHDIPIAVLSAVAKHLDTTPSYLVWGSEEDEGWLSELGMIAGSIRNPMVRETALKQMLALARMDENM